VRDTIRIELRDGTPIRANREAWGDSVRIATRVMQGTLRDNTGGALYYYAHGQVSPTWAQHQQQTRVIGAHTFLR
jgi:spore germination cell wall hydrolase CwlJ-like protein